MGTLLAHEQPADIGHLSELHDLLFWWRFSLLKNKANFCYCCFLPNDVTPWHAFQGKWPAWDLVVVNLNPSPAVLFSWWTDQKWMGTSEGGQRTFFWKTKWGKKSIPVHSKIRSVCFTELNKPLLPPLPLSLWSLQGGMDWLFLILLTSDNFCDLSLKVAPEDVLKILSQNMPFFFSLSG